MKGIESSEVGSRRRVEGPSNFDVISRPASHTFCPHEYKRIAPHEKRLVQLETEKGRLDSCARHPHRYHRYITHNKASMGFPARCVRHVIHDPNNSNLTFIISGNDRAGPLFPPFVDAFAPGVVFGKE